MQITRHGFTRTSRHASEKPSAALPVSSSINPARGMRLWIMNCGCVTFPLKEPRSECNKNYSISQFIPLPGTMVHSGRITLPHQGISVSDQRRPETILDRPIYEIKSGIKLWKSGFGYLRYEMAVKRRRALSGVLVKRYLIDRVSNSNKIEEAIN